MKTKFFLFMLLLVGFSDLSAQTPTPTAVVDTVKVGFKEDKDTISIAEGKSQIIEVELNGSIPKNSIITIKWKIKNSDATLDKDFGIIADDSLVFGSVQSKTQLKYLKITALKDLNIENEKFTIELNIFKGGNLVKLTKPTCVIILEDFKTDLQNAEEEIAVLKADFAAQKKLIVEKVSEIINAKDSSEVIGKIRLKNATLTQWMSKEGTKNKGYKKNTNEIEEMKSKAIISSVDVRFKYGVASEIRAFTKDSTEIFSNLWSPSSEQICHRYGISYRHNALSKRNEKYYLIGEKDKSVSIKLGDVLDYTHKTGLNFVPSDTTVTLYNQKDKKEASIYVKTSLTSYINFNIYTDLLGLLRIDQGNGLIQSDASAKIYLTTLPARNKLRFHLNYLMPYARYSRFENSFQNVPNTENKSFETSMTNNISRMLLNQRKYFDAGLKLNIVNWIGKFDNNYELNAFSGFGWFNRQGPVDSENTTKTGTTQYQGILTNTFEFGLETRAAFLQYRNFGINTGFMATYQKIINAELNKIDNGGFKPFYRTEAEVFYYPIKNSKDKIFLRTYYTFNGSKVEESFLRVQVGYKALFKISNKK